MCLSYHEIRNVGVTARKPHMCAWCAETIHASELARLRIYIFDGNFTSDHMHPECYAAMEMTPTEEYCDGWMPGDFERGVSLATQKAAQR